MLTERNFPPRQFRVRRPFARLVCCCALLLTASAVTARGQEGGWVAARRGPAKKDLNTVYFADSKRGWVGGDRGTILHTEDGGDNWRQQRTSIIATLYHVDFDDKETGWAVGEHSTILRTTDGGATWLAVAVPALGPLAKLLSVAFADNDDGWIVGRGGTVLRSSDGGRTWVRQESGTKQNLYALFVRDKRAWAVGGDGMVLQYER